MGDEEGGKLGRGGKGSEREGRKRTKEIRMTRENAIEMKPSSFRAKVTSDYEKLLLFKRRIPGSRSNGQTFNVAGGCAECRRPKRQFAPI